MADGSLLAVLPLQARDQSAGPNLQGTKMLLDVPALGCRRGQVRGALLNRRVSSGDPV